jgi:hypothetical protein
MTNVFVAPKIRVGYQNRQGTFTGKLAYIIYFDEKGKLRKEASWQKWRDEKCGVDDYDNKPIEGFTINKDIKRYNGEWFSSTRTMVRIHDPRGFEFEVTTENLIAILMHTDCLRRGLIGEFVYAWVGPELVLLPTNSEEYQAATKYTEGLSKKVGAKELVPGISYRTKREGDVVYIGKFNWYSYEGKRYTLIGKRTEEKVHVFTKDDGKTFFNKGSVSSYLSSPNSDVPVSNLADLIDKFNKQIYANKVARLDFRPVSFDPTLQPKDDKYYYGPRLERQHYFVEDPQIPGVYVQVNANVQSKWVRDPNDNSKGEHTLIGYSITDEYGYYDHQGIRASDGELVNIPKQQDRGSIYGRYYYNSPDRDKPQYTEETVKNVKLFDLYVVWDNGKENKVNSMYEFVRSGT